MSPTKGELRRMTRPQGPDLRSGQGLDGDGNDRGHKPTFRNRAKGDQGLRIAEATAVEEGHRDEDADTRLGGNRGVRLSWAVDDGR